MDQHNSPESLQATTSRLERMRLAAAAMTLTAVALLAPNSSALADDIHPADAETSSELVQASQKQQAIPDIAITSYNILGANHTRLSSEVGGTVKARAFRTVRFILGKAGARPSDIVGMQEIEPVQRHLFDNQLHKHYASVPKDKSAENPIFYNKDRFDLLATGFVRYPYYGDPGLRAHNGKAVWARLQDKNTDQVVTVINEHPVAWNQNPGSDKGGAEKRERTAHLIANWVRSQQQLHPNSAMFDIGDMNSINVPLNYFDPYFTFQFKDRALNGNRNRIGYCIKTEKEVGLQDSRDVLRGHTGHCLNKSRGPDYRHQIDWIYLNPRFTNVKSWRVIDNTITRHASDHLPLMAITEARPEALSSNGNPAKPATMRQFAEGTRRRYEALQQAGKDPLQYAATPTYRRLRRSAGPDH